MNADPESQSIMVGVVVLIILTVLNAFFSAAEAAIVSINKNEVERKANEGDETSVKLLQFICKTKTLLATIQVGMVVITLLQGAALIPLFSKQLADLFSHLSYAKQLAQVIVIIVLAYVIIVFGYLYPRRIALNKTEEVIRFVKGPVLVLSMLLKPFVWLVTTSTNVLGRMTSMTFDNLDEKMTREEMEYMITNEGLLDSEELGMVKGIFDMDTTLAREVMVPRTEAFMIDIQDETSVNVDKMVSGNFSRIPVYDDDKDKIIGIIHLKNLIKAARKSGFDQLDLLKVIHEPLFVPETIFIDDLMIELKKTQNHMAILLDEYGGVVGLVTLEDLLEEIVGEIDDESDETTIDEFYQHIDQDTYIIQGRMPIDDFNEVFDTDLHMNDVDTMAGFLITALGAIPEKGQRLSIERDNVTLITHKVEGTRLLEIEAHIHEKKVEQTNDVNKNVKIIGEK